MILSFRQQTPPDSTIRTTKYFDTFSTQTTFPPTIYRKPVRIVKAVQRSVQSPSINHSTTPLSTKINSENDFKPLSLPYTDELIINNQYHRSSDYIRNLFPIPDRLKRKCSKQNLTTINNMNDIQTMFNDNIRQTEDLLLNLKRNLEILQENQRIINDEIEINTILGTKLINIIESKAELNEIEKVKLHISEIDTITSILLKLSSRLAKVENDLLMITDDNAHTKASLLERREKIQEKHNEAKSLKDGIDRRSRLVTNILRKYFSDEQYDDYDHFIRMKSTLLIDTKDIEENITFLQKQIDTLLNKSSLSSPSSLSSSSVVNNQQYSSTSSISLFENLQRSNSTNKVDNLQTNYFNTISSTA
ncbi:unnamed protein product [Rotaria sordida]|uniref:ASD2 domain-containing protein n=1 Tax=Rotaria sordida TaxID=392033 RepID=A0A815CPS7_9BILA|nr:unnamed protein product [Rotaria sordida]CAF1255369.1 unnamed protein product [Rotaria sordida]CAF1285722.1 unnamed protein product [Rotaria sordida]CAF1368705.1 unnamed protein product [Rotaria sordida]CAF1563216.1 unnamed protein product [Rotaria sordida]